MKKKKKENKEKQRIKKPFTTEETQPCHKEMSFFFYSFKHLRKLKKIKPLNFILQGIRNSMDSDLCFHDASILRQKPHACLAEKS